MQESVRETFTAVFRGASPDKLLWAPDLTWWRDAHAAFGTLPERYRGDEGFLALHEDVSAMPYYIYALDSGNPSGGTGDTPGHSVHQIGGEGKPYNGVWNLEYEGVDVDVRISGDITETVFTVDGRELVQRKRYLADSHCFAFLEYPVKNREDLLALRTIIDGYRFSEDSDVYRELSKSWGEKGVPIAPLPRSPLSALIVDWMGLENFIFADLEERALVEEILEKIDAANDEAYEIVISSPAELFHFCDNLSASNYASYFSRLADAYYRRRITQLHLAGKLCVSHLDGTIRGLLGPLAATGVDGIEALTTAPVGDVATADLREMSGRSDLVLWGMVPAALFGDSYPESQLRSAVQEVIEAHRRDGRLIAGSADQVPPNARLDRIAMVGEMIRESWI